ncbi:arsenate reductase ArsC [Zunongwangia sp.]|uniref:arsenate reductase ArsC n=1 Tax=Zunongwangia sp. TaxID=1965325 RepID=UPI003AA8A882
MKNVLVLCTGNSCRSQIAHGYLNYFGMKKAQFYSAGVAKHGVKPRSIAIMQEDGIDISDHTCNLVEEYENVDFDFVITVCDHAKETCPVFFSEKTKVLHQNFKDPSTVKGSDREIHDAFEKARDEIKLYCKKFVREYL